MSHDAWLASPADEEDIDLTSFDDETGQKIKKEGRTNRNTFVLLPPTDTTAPIPLPDGNETGQLLDEINGVLSSHHLPLWTGRQLGSPGHCEITSLEGATTLNPRRVELALKIRLPDEAETSTKLRVGGRFVFVVPVIGMPADGAETAGAIERSVHLVARSRLEGRMDGNGWLKAFAPSVVAQVEQQFGINGLSWEVPRSLVMDFDERRERGTKDTHAHDVLRAVFGDAYVDALDWAAVMPIGEHRIKGEFSMARIYYLEANCFAPVEKRLCRSEFIRLPLRKVVLALNKLTGIADSESVAVLASAVLKAPTGFFG